MRRHDREGLPVNGTAMVDDAVLDVSSEVEGGFPCGRFLLDEEDISMQEGDASGAPPEMS